MAASNVGNYTSHLLVFLYQPFVCDRSKCLVTKKLIPALGHKLMLYCHNGYGLLLL